MRWLGAALLLAGCDSLLGEKTTFCPATNAICPSGLVCAGDVTLCGTPDEVNACRGIAELGECSSGEAPHGYCTSAICTACDPNFSWCHYSGWSQMTNVALDLYSVWAVGANDVYVGANPGTVFHYNGSEWGQLATIGSAPLTALWASSDHDIFAIDAGAFIRHYDGTTWTQTSSSFLHGIWGAGPQDVYAVGSSGVISHYAGSTWSAQTSPTTNILHSVWGADATHVFAAGLKTIVFSPGDGSWQTSLNDPAIEFTSIFGTSPSDVIAVGNCIPGQCTGTVARHFNGTAWEPATSISTSAAAMVTGVWTGAANTAVATSADGTISRYNGTAWAPETLDSTNRLWAIHGTAADDVYAVGVAGFIWHYEGP